MRKPISMRAVARMAALGSALALAGPAAAGTVYAWRTEDGGFAFSDDLKSVPARYRDRVETRESGRLADYARFTSEDPVATARYAERLAARLAYLRALNGADAAQAASRAPEPGFAVRVSGTEDPSIDVSPRAGEGPVVVETLQTRPEGKMVTRPSLVVRQGGRTLAIVKPRSRQWDVARDVHDEGELER